MPLLRDSSQGTRIPVFLDDVAPIAVSATIAAEDQRFWRHPGVDPFAVGRALTGALATQGRPRGASTLTQQLARRLYLPDDDGPVLLRKAREALIALQLEARLPKRELIETYLNHVYYGSEAEDAGARVSQGVSEDASDLISRHVHRRADVISPVDPNQNAFLLYALTAAWGQSGFVPYVHAPAMRSIVEQERSRLTNWGRAYLLLGLLATGRDVSVEPVRQLLNDLTADIIASANGNHWEDERRAGSMHNSSVRTTALVLRALTEVDSRHPLIEETVRWLVHARSLGKWKTTVARAQGMSSLGAYAQLTGETLGRYDYSVWLNTREVLDGTFDVTAGDYLDGTEIPLVDLPLGEVSRVQLQRSTDPGRMYYGLNLRYVTPALGIEALNRGLAISHRYSLLGEPDEVVTSASLGDVVRVQVTIVAPHDRLFVLVEDFLPSGLEPINPKLRTVAPELIQQLEADRRSTRLESAPEDYAPWYAWYYSPWRHVDIRDDRLVLQASSLPRGVHEYVYYARATTPGEFIVPPAHAEESYFPEVFGRSDSGRFTVVGD